ncbi:hypothetical protein P7C70_g2980, partial [Phenoliferia sp. Uapishka_3]
MPSVYSPFILAPPFTSCEEAFIVFFASKKKSREEREQELNQSRAGSVMGENGARVGTFNMGAVQMNEPSMERLRSLTEAPPSYGPASTVVKEEEEELVVSTHG